MRVSAKAEYACRAMLELSICHKETTITQINDIATRQNIPKKYLVQILLQLQRAGLVKSKRGATGGYMLAKSPAAITLGDVMRTAEGTLMAIESLEGQINTLSNSPSDCVQLAMRQVWQDVQTQVSNIVDNITFEDICKKADQTQTMYYI